MKTIQLSEKTIKLLREDVLEYLNDDDFHEMVGNEDDPEYEQKAKAYADAVDELRFAIDKAV